VKQHAVCFLSSFPFLSSPPLPSLPICVDSVPSGGLGKLKRTALSLAQHPNAPPWVSATSWSTSWVVAGRDGPRSELGGALALVAPYRHSGRGVQWLMSLTSIYKIPGLNPCVCVPPAGILEQDSLTLACPLRIGISNQSL
jgi:hypothetical protein